MNMREKVAHAIAAIHHDGQPFDELDQLYREMYLRDADAALEALREPTEGMVATALADCNFVGVVVAYRAMIDAAREGK